MPARQAIYVDLVDRSDLLNAIALNSSVFNGARIIGPAIGGFVVSQLGEAPAFTINAITYLAVLASLLLMRIQPRDSSSGKGNGLQNLKQGLNYLRHERRVLGLVVMVAAFSVVGFSYLTLIPVFAQDVLNIGAEGFGGLLAAQGFGALIAALSLAFKGNSLPKGKLLVASRALLAFAILILSLSRQTPLTRGCTRTGRIWAHQSIGSDQYTDPTYCPRRVPRKGAQQLHLGIRGVFPHWFSLNWILRGPNRSYNRSAYFCDLQSLPYDFW
jgi:predicted MFS family arabinose efflux permease